MSHLSVRLRNLGLGLVVVLLLAVVVTAVTATSQPANSTPTIYLPTIANNSCSSQAFDDFSNPITGWPVGENTYTRYLYTTDDNYSIFHKEADRWTAVTINDRRVFVSQVPVPIGDIQPFEVQTGLLTADIYGLSGIIFGLNDDWTDFFTFELIQKAQRWYLFHYNESSGWTLWHSGIYPMNPVGQMNTIRYYSGTLFINSNHIVNMGGEVNGRIGLTGGSFTPNTDLRYDNYSFERVGCPSAVAYWETIPATLDLHLQQRETLLAPYIQTP